MHDQRISSGGNVFESKASSRVGNGAASRLLQLYLHLKLNLRGQIDKSAGHQHDADIADRFDGSRAHDRPLNGACC
jgi:hypothetical protein